jgi:hypothetical protein
LDQRPDAFFLTVDGIRTARAFHLETMDPQWPALISTFDAPDALGR